MTLNELLPGNMGRVVLTRVAVRLRMPALLSMSPSAPLDAALVEKLTSAILTVQKG